MKTDGGKSTEDNMFLIDIESIYEKQINKQFFDVVGVFVAAVDLKGNIRFLNKQARNLLNLNEEELTDRNFIENLIADDHKKMIRHVFDEILIRKNPSNSTHKFHFKTHTNETRIIEINTITILDNQNSVNGILISGKDITDYLKDNWDLRKDLNLYRLLVNSIPEINVFLFDKNKYFRIAEGKEMLNLGLTRENFEGNRLEEIPNKKLKEIWEPLFEEALKGKEVNREYQLNNYYYKINIQAFVNDHKEFRSAIVVTRNITHEKITKKNLEESEAAAVKMSRTKNEFIAKISHDIRTPLNAILGFTEQLSQTELNDNQKKFVNIIDRSSEHLLSLINDILVMSKIEANQINFERNPFKIKYTVKFIYNALKEKAREKNLRFTYDIDEKLNLVLQGDTFRLQQILLNITGNAVKFTNKGFVEIKCFLQEENEDEAVVRFDIIDTGIGIQPEEINHIFNKYKQLDDGESKRLGGTGLGLAIAKNLIELQQGTLSVSSQPGIGTSFTFTIPFSKGKESELFANEKTGIDVDRFKDKKILLVDDDSVNRLLAKTILDKFNTTYELAENGKTAIQKLDETFYDLILLDIHMPDISGLEVADYIRNKQKNKKTKIIALTAAALKDDIDDYYKNGIDDFIIKPFKEINLYNKMSDILNLTTKKYTLPKTEIILKNEINPRSYDLQNLKNMSGNDHSLVIKMLQTFIDNSKNAIKDLNKHLKSKNWKEIGEVAHKILPSYKHLEVDDVTSNLTEIKTKSLINADHDPLPDLTRETIEKMKKIMHQLEEEIAGNQ